MEEVHSCFVRACVHNATASFDSDVLSTVLMSEAWGRRKVSEQFQ